MDRCPDCGTDLGAPFRIDSKIVEEIPKPQPIIVTEYRIAHYRCPCCRKEVAAKNAGLPHEGKFGNNVIAQASLLKYEDRLPHRKIQDAMKRLFGLKISPATVFDLTRRAADAVRSEYDAILSKIRSAPILYVDETSIRVQGERHWIWAFTTPTESFFVIRKTLLRSSRKRFHYITLSKSFMRYYSKLWKAIPRQKLERRYGNWREKRFDTGS